MSNTNKRKNAARIVATLLALLLILGVVAVLLPVDAEQVSCYSDTMIRIGLNYCGDGANTLVNKMVNTFAHGFEIGTYDESAKTFSSIVSYPDNVVNVTAAQDGVSITFTSPTGELLYSHSLVGQPIFIRPLASYDGEYVLTNCSDGNSYSGILEYKRTVNANMTVINILRLEDYIKGVLPKEIYPSWPAEALKAAAVAARTFALFEVGGKHSSHDFDLCNTTHCQVFEGNGNNCASTDAAVDATCGEILTYNGKPAMTPYHVSSGGATESAAGCWGGAEDRYPYLCGVFTPLEAYETYPNGTWSNTLSATELAAYINTKGKGTLVGPVKNIECKKGNTGYVQNIVISDAFGNTVSASGSNNVRALLSNYVMSANFTIKTYCEVPINDGVYTIDTQNVPIITSQGVQNVSILPFDAKILSSSGLIFLLNRERDDETMFTIEGKGHGHGVGLSQYGSMTLAETGHDYMYILDLYFPTTILCRYSA